MKSAILLFGLILSTGLQPAESKGYDFFTGLSSQKNEQRCETVEFLEKLPKEEKIEILRDVYINNDKLFEEFYYNYNLIQSLKLISSFKSAALEAEVYAEIDNILDSEEADPKIMYRVPWFTDRLKYYIRTLPYVGVDGDRSFDVIFRFIKLHRNTSSDVNDGLITLTELPYKPDNDHILQLLEVLSYHINYTNFSAALQYIEKAFKRYANENNNALFIERLSQHIEELRSIKLGDNKGGRQSYLLNERIKTFEKLVAEYSQKYETDKTPAKQAIYITPDIHSIVSSVSPQKAVPVFHGSIPVDGPKRQTYNEKLAAGIYSKPLSIAGIEYRVGLAYLQTEGVGRALKDQALYLLVSNPSSGDKVVSASFQQINAAGFIINETNLTHNAVTGGSNNTVIGTKLSNLSTLAQNIKITVTVRDIEYAEPEIPLYKRELAKSANLANRGFAFKKDYFKPTSNNLPDGFKALIDQNQRNLKFDKLTKQICKDIYTVEILRFWSDKTEDQYLLYSASCTRWSGECNGGHERQVLYKATSAKGGKTKQLLLLISEGNTFTTIESINDINNDGNIELSINKNYCLSSSTSIQKLKNGSLIMLNKGVNYSEGGYVENPFYITNPFVYSQK